MFICISHALTLAICPAYLVHLGLNTLGTYLSSWLSEFLALNHIFGVAVLRKVKSALELKIQLQKIQELYRY
jgi:hypothetical protein